MSPMIGWGDKIQILDFGTEHLESGSFYAYKKLFRKRSFLIRCKIPPPKPKKMIFTKFEQCGMMGLGMF